MKKDITEEILFNRQVNYIIIEGLWERLNKGQDKREFYKLLRINKNTYSRIRKADTYNCVDLDARWEAKNSVIRKMGLSKEIMTGKEMIELDGITKEEWVEYLNLRYVDKEVSSYRSSTMQNMNRKLNAFYKSLEVDKKDKRDIGKLLYFFTYGRSVEQDLPDMEMVELKNALNHITVEKMKVCDKELREEVFVKLKEIHRQLNIIVSYDKL